MADHPVAEPANPRERAFLAEALADPSWLLQEIDFPSGRAAFVRVPEETYRESPFLDHRLHGQAGTPVITRLGALVEAAAGSPPATHWIFHLGHVGSTLLSRLLGELPEILPVREPLPLRNLAGLRREQGDPLAHLDPAGYERFERAILALLGRTYGPEQIALVKATSDCCNLLGRVLRANPSSRAVWLYVDLETFLAGMLRNEARREETRAFGQTRLRDLHEILGDRSIRLHELGAARLTAVSWLANQAQWLRDGAGEPRALRVHFHDLLAEPGEALTRILEHLGVPAGPGRVQALARSRWHGTYAKDPRNAFSAEQRYRQLAESRRANGGAIQEAMTFARGLCDRHSVLKELIPELSARADMA